MVGMSETKKRQGGGRAYHSVLEPHTERIRLFRRQRLTWKEIAARLANECGLSVTLHAVYKFCRRRQRRSRSWEEAWTCAQPQVEAPPMVTVSDSPSPTLPANELRQPQSPAAQVLRPYLPVTKFRRPDTAQFKKEDYL